MKYVLASLIALQIIGCASVNSVSLSSIPAVRNKEVRSEKVKTIFLGFNFNNDFVDEMAEDLKRQCPNGMIKGILTKDEVIDYFLMIVWAHKVTATGYCVQARNTASVGNSGDAE
ncbi:MAG: hypothetical protein H7326_01905 [Bdellovibrionaceae bacterium]|nr:hypothetical protein [Pseudobdellovibrionaceae bacterium]